MQQISEIVIEEVTGEDGVKKSVTFGEVLNQITTVILSDRGAFMVACLLILFKVCDLVLVCR